MPTIRTTVTTDGSGDGNNLSATNVAQWNGSVASGILQGVRLEFGASPDAGTDITISEIGGLQRQILAVSDTNTATSYNPQNLIQTNAGASASAYAPFVLDSSNIQVVVEQGGDTKTVTAILEFA